MSRFEQPGESAGPSIFKGSQLFVYLEKNAILEEKDLQVRPIDTNQGPSGLFGRTPLDLWANYPFLLPQKTAESGTPKGLELSDD